MIRKISLLVMVFVVLGLANQGLTSAQDANVHVRFAHLASEVGALDVSVNEQSAVDALRYGELSEWFNYVPTRLEVSVTAADGTALTVPEFDTAMGEWFTVAFVMIDGEFDARVIEEDFGPLDTGESRLTLFNAFAQVPAVDVTVDDALFSQGLQTGEFLIVPVIANTYSLGFSSASEPDDIIADVRSLELTSQSNTFVALLDSEGSSGETIIVETLLSEINGLVENEPVVSVEGQSNLTVVRVAHLSSGTPPLDVYFDGELPGTNRLRFPEFTNWFALPTGTYTLAVTLAGEPYESAIIDPFDVTLNAGTYNDIVIIGTLANNSLVVHIVEEDFSDIGVNSVRVNLLNAHPGIGPIDLRQTDGANLISRLAYPGFLGGNDGFSWVILESGTYDLEFLTEDGDVWVEVSGATFIEGRNYFISLISADPPFLLTFSDISETRALMELEPASGE